MSWAATAYVKRLTHGTNGEPLDRTEKLVLYGIADYFNDEAMAAWPSAARLAEECLISRRGLFRVLERLVDKGLVEIVRRQGENGLFESNLFRLPGLQPDRPLPPMHRKGSDSRSLPHSRRRSDRESPVRHQHGAGDESPPASEQDGDRGSPPAHLGGGRGVTRGSDSAESPRVVTQLSHPNPHPTAKRNLHPPPAAAVRSTSRGRAPLPGGGWSLSLPRDGLTASFAKIDGRLPEVPDVLVDYRAMHDQLTAAGIDGEEFWRRARELRRRHPTWRAINVRCVFRQGHTVARAPAPPAPPPRPAPSGQRAAPPRERPSPAPPSGEAFEAQRAAAARAREGLLERFPRLGLSPPTRPPRLLTLGAG